MLGRFAKLLLVATSLAPILVTYGVARFETDHNLSFLCWFIALALLAICLLILHFSKTRLEIHTFRIKFMKNADQEVLAFIIAYLLPLAGSRGLVSTNIGTSVFVLSLLAVAIYNSNAYHYNPLMGFFGYHFYEVRNEQSMTFIMVTRSRVRDVQRARKVVDLSDYMILDLGESE